MSPRASRTIRRVLDLPRLPKSMSKAQRVWYRSLKAKYRALPAPAKRLFLDNVTALKSTMPTVTA